MTMASMCDDYSQDRFKNNKTRDNKSPALVSVALSTRWPNCVAIPTMAIVNGKSDEVVMMMNTD